MQAGVQQGFSVEAALTVELDGERISSTRVRQALQAGELELAERLLGRPYALAGRVLHGQKLARQLGTPTANVQLKRRKPPLRRVFLVSALHAGHRFHGVANIGQRPTVAGDGSPHRSAFAGIRWRPLWPAPDSGVSPQAARRAAFRLSGGAEDGDRRGCRRRPGLLAWPTA